MTSCLQRDEAVQQFRNGDVWMLICTQLLGRGIDFVGVNLVVNFDFPQSAVSYIHTIGSRIVAILRCSRNKLLWFPGRTGRAGRKGKAVTFFTYKDMLYLRT